MVRHSKNVTMHKSKRILAAVMFTDMVGFTALMSTDEALARKKIDRHRQVIEEQHEKFEGKIINYFGDGTLSIFTSSVNAVECAIEIQGQLKTPINVPVRIGIDVGDIVFEKGNILGDAVNLASRIESFSVPGAILISEAVYRQVKNHSHFQCKSLGQFYFKNIPKPSKVYAVANPGLIVPDPSELKGKGHREVSSNEKFPKTLTTFLGREKEVEEICDLLNTHRLITLTGPGGTGKTSLSVKVAWEVVDRFPGGIFWMPLVSVKNTEAVAMECVSYFGLKEDPVLSSEDVLIAFFKEKKALLVLDNFEHVIKAAHVIDQLHKACTELAILVSSRIILQVQGEKEYQVPPFKVPILDKANTLDELKETPSVALFTQRAQASRRNFTLTHENSKTVAEICVRLDGLPLGIELAAARTKIFSPESLLKRLNTSFDVLKGGGQFPPRHQTIRQTIAWSYDLLEMEEQLLFKCISLFVGGCTLEAIEEICGENELLNGDIVEGVMALVDKSLLSTDDSANELRFFMLETINEFASEELGKYKEKSVVKKAYINYYLRLTEEAEPHFYSSEAEVWDSIVSPELPNIRAAIDHAIDLNEMALAYR
ncbi:MAG: adenylate/guanylate cyclase domain-containing protein, partial [Maribacter sp.]|nr:adenylate/guanylate cyclase domain-containing protein [Maribacter sp.]